LFDYVDKKLTNHHIINDYFLPLTRSHCPQMRKIRKTDYQTDKIIWLGHCQLCDMMITEKARVAATHKSHSRTWSFLR